MKYLQKIKKIVKNKITYFDVIFAVIIIAIIGGVYFFFNRDTVYIDIKVRITDQDVIYANTNPKMWYANRFNIGDTEYDELGKVISKITNVETFNTTADTKVVYLTINVRAVYDPRTKLYGAKGTNLTFGNNIRFNFPDVSFNGLITESPSTEFQNEYSLETKTITVIARGPNTREPEIEPEMLEKIKINDKITNSSGTVLAQVKNISLRPGQRVTTDQFGNLHLRQDPFYKDAIITLDVLVKKNKDDEFVFDVYPLKLGTKLPLNFSYETVETVITGVN